MVWLSDAARFIQFACVLSLFGVTSWMLVRPGAAHSAPQPRWSIRRWLLVYGSVCLFAAAATIGWLLTEAATIAGRWSAVAEVVASARFGRAAALRAALLVAAALVARLMPRRSRRLWPVLALLCAAAILSFIGTGHGSTGSGAAAAVHAIADALHLFCAAIWIGALVVLSASAGQALANQTAAAASTLLNDLLLFSTIGPALIGLLIVTGLINTWLLVAGHWGALLVEPYGLLLSGKVGVFAVMLALAAYHRYRSTPRLRQFLVRDSTGVAEIGTLKRTLFVESALALLVLAIVAVLGNLEPPASSWH